MRCVVAFSAVGSLREEFKPRDFSVPDQVIDRTKGVSFELSKHLLFDTGATSDDGRVANIEFMGYELILSHMF